MKFDKLDKTDMVVLHEVTRGVRYFRRLDPTLERLSRHGFVVYEPRQLWRDSKVEAGQRLNTMVQRYGKDKVMQELDRNINNAT